MIYADGIRYLDDRAKILIKDYAHTAFAHNPQMLANLLIHTTILEILGTRRYARAR